MSSAVFVLGGKNDVWAGGVKRDGGNTNIFCLNSHFFRVRVQKMTYVKSTVPYKILAETKFINKRRD